MGRRARAVRLDRIRMIRRVVWRHQLSVEHLFEILQHSEGSIIRQYERAFRAYGIEVIFEQEGLKAIAELAHEEKTGARGLRSILEHELLETMYDMPSMENVVKVVVDESVISGASEPLLIYEGDRQRAVTEQ